MEAKRWEKIAAALGNRTFKQVPSLSSFMFNKISKISYECLLLRGNEKLAVVVCVSQTT